ncbi:MAG: 6-phosphogluconolactonase [Parasphingorhabdus sp.]|nr:6-phosphogluconolactonase [Parasphingorhabdus sp.]
MVDPDEIEWWDFEDAAEMADAVAGDIAFIIESALDARGQALIALPGGKAVMPVLHALAEKPLQWKHVTIFPTDDLLVAVDDERSRVRALAQMFMPRGARVLPLSSENPDYKMAGAAANARLTDLHWPPDLVWLTMHDSGGTAGLVASDDLAEAMAADKNIRAVGIQAAGAEMPHISITRAAIAEARTVMFLLEGSDAQATLETAITDGAKSKLPIGRVFASLNVPVDIYVLTPSS